MTDISSLGPGANRSTGGVKRPTIRDVARLSGVSVSTVSHALSGHRPVKASTSERVRRAVDELGYQPDPVAQAMITGRSRTLGLILPDIVNPFFPQVVRGIEDAAAESGYSLILGNTNLQLERELSYVDAFAARRVSGIIFMPGDPEADQTLRHLRRTGMPYILLDEALEGADGGGAFSDNVDGGYRATRHLLETGRERLVYLGGPLGLPTVTEREAGFTRAIAEASLSPIAIRYGPYRAASGAEMITALLDQGVEFDGLFAADDLIALGAIQALAASGRRVPTDVGVCGFDGIAGTELWTPSLTTVVQAAYDLGATGARLLLDHLEGRTARIPRVVLPVELVVRASTASATVPLVAA
jgi:LacI family transcriptional regulator